MLHGLSAPDMTVQEAATNLGCTAVQDGSGWKITHGLGSYGTAEIGSIPKTWVAVRPDGYTTFHRGPALAILALLNTYYTPAKGQ